jgi:hypothetical protein
MGDKQSGRLRNPLVIASRAAFWRRRPSGLCFTRFTMDAYGGFAAIAGFLSDG